MLIPISMFDKCLIDNLTRKEIIKLFSGRENGAYYLDKFSNLLLTHNISLRDYCIQYLKIEWPRCPVSKELVGYNITGKGLKLSHFKRGHISKSMCPKFKEACEKFSLERRGSKNPMYGAKPWNKGLKSETDDRVKKVAQKRIGIKVGEETRAKQRLARKNSPLKVRHGIPHSKETIEKLRRNTSLLWARGAYNRKTSIEQKVEDFLKTIPLKEPYVFQYQIDYFTVDFAFPTAKIAIECQGTFFHIDPRIYPNGPICAVQRRNFGRDKAKKKWCVDKMGWNVIELWETEINDGTFKEILKCKLSELNLLNQ